MANGEGAAVGNGGDGRGETRGGRPPERGSGRGGPTGRGAREEGTEVAGLEILVLAVLIPNDRPGNIATG